MRTYRYTISKFLLGGMILSVLLFAFQARAAAWDYQQNFDALTLGDLNGQDSWSGDATFDVEDSVVAQGTKAVSANSSTEVLIDRTITANPDSGTFWFAMRTTLDAGAGDQSGAFIILKTAGSFGRVRFNNHNIIADGLSAVTLVTGYSVDTWYTIGIQFVDATHAKFNVNGGTFSSSIDMGGTGVDTIRLSSPDGTAATAYWDNITTSDPNTSNSCTPPASGAWWVKASDNCYITASKFVTGILYIKSDTGPGSFNIIDNAVVSIAGLQNTSTSIYVEAGSQIKFWTAQ